MSELEFIREVSDKDFPRKRHREEIPVRGLRCPREPSEGPNGSEFPPSRPRVILTEIPRLTLKPATA